MSVTARGLAEARHLMLSDLEASRSLPITPDMDTLAVGAYMTATNRHSLHLADLFTVTPDACVLAAHAAADLPDTYRPPAQDIPVPVGLMMWEEPPCTVPDPDHPTGRSLPVVAASWSIGPGSSGVVGVLFTLYTDTDHGRPFPAWRSALAPVRLGSLALGDGRPVQPWAVADPDADRVVRVLLTTWLLMAQGATDEAATPAPPARTRLARTLAKRGRPLPDVRVVDLHRAPSTAPAASSGRTVSVRYAVRGHWRQQPYGPARTLRRPVWIHPHVRGPQDAPWATGTTVGRLRAPTTPPTTA